MPPAASREEIVELIGEVEGSFIQRILDTHASVDEIAEAIDDLEGRFAELPHIATTTRVIEVRHVLAELFATNGRAL